MNIDQLRASLKSKWLTYYRQNRSWIARLEIWVSDQGQRRPASSFMLATLSILEPELVQLMPLISALSRDPDHIIESLGLNFNPDRLLDRMADAEDLADERSMKYLPEARSPHIPPSLNPHTQSTLREDATCEGTNRPMEIEVLQEN